MTDLFSLDRGLPIETVSWFARAEEASTHIKSNKDEASSTIPPRMKEPSELLSVFIDR